MPVQTQIVRRPAGFNEKMDCTVRALANATNMPYEEAHQLFKSAGRKDGHRTNVHQFLYSKFGQAESMYGKTYGNTGCYPSLKRFTDHHSTGRYIVQVQGHVFAMVDGVIIDAGKNGTRRKVSFCWKINPDMVR